MITVLDVPHIAIGAKGEPARFGAFGLRVLTGGASHGHGLLADVQAGFQWGASLGITALLTAPDDTFFLLRRACCLACPSTMLSVVCRIPAPLHCHPACRMVGHIVRNAIGARFAKGC